jgi:hypothetical protein
MIGAGRDIIVKIVAGAVSEVVRQGSIGILDTASLVFSLPKLRAEEKRREVLAYKLGYRLKNSLP